MPSVTATPLPDRPARVPLEQLAVKEAVGIALWNGSLGASGEVYLAKIRMPNTGEEVARFLGGTAVPSSVISSWNQSLIWIQDYLDEAMPQEAIAGYLVLHRACSIDQPIYANSRDLSEVSAISVPAYEMHGILPVGQAFLMRHADKLVRYSAESGGPITDGAADIRINNAGQARILSHMLNCLRQGRLRCEIEVKRGAFNAGREPARLQM